MRAGAAPSGAGSAQGLGRAAVPRLQAGFAAGGGFRALVVVLARGVGLVAAGQEVEAAGEVGVGEVAGEGVEDAGAGGGRRHAKVVAVQQVVGGEVVQGVDGRRLALHGE